MKSFNEIFNAGSKVFGRILSTILEKRYRKLIKADGEYGWITLDVLFEWVVWPNYLKLVQQGASCQYFDIFLFTVLY